MNPPRKQFDEDFWVKATSVVVAIMVWVVTPRDSSESIWGRGRWNPFQAVIKTESRTFEDLPITVLTGATDPRGFLVFPSVATIEITGEQEAVRKLLPEEIEIYVNLTDVVEANGLRKQLRVRVPGGLQWVRLDPTSVEVRISTQPPESESAVVTKP